MPDFDQLLVRWRKAGLLDAQAEDRIRTYEVAQEKFEITGIRWQGMIALILGAILLVCGVVLFVSARWDQFAPGVRFAITVGMVAAVHLSGGLAREKMATLSAALHAAGTAAAGAAILITGEIFNMQAHWPAAILLWTLAAMSGWLLLRDQAQQTLALLLAPAWMCCELNFYMAGHIGADAFMGRALFIWSILYLTFFTRSDRKVVQGTLFAVAAIAAVIGSMMMTAGWASFSSTQTFVGFTTRFWAWAAIAALPLAIAAFHGHKGLIPIALATLYAVALPWCNRVWTQTQSVGGAYRTITRTEPNLAAHAIMVLFAAFLCLWGVRIASRALVNLSVVYFGLAVAWFYFSNIWDKVGRSFGLIGLGILFLAGGWVLEKTRRRLMSHMDAATTAAEVAP